MDGWSLVYTDSVAFGAEVCRSRLEGSGVKAVLLNKQDSSYGMFGSVEVYVPTEDLKRAKAVLSAPEHGETPT